MADVRLEDIQSALSQWARQEIALKDEVRLLRDRVDELDLLNRHSIKQVQDGFGLPDNPDSTLKLAVEEALLAVTSRGAEQVRTIESQKDEIDRLRAKVTGLESEQQECVDRLVEALELPPNKHRTLRNATTEACEMVVEAKKMVRENL